MDKPVDLRSDTVTRPTPGMREAMASAEVGDDVFGEDPTVNELQRRAAGLLGKSAALFVPSGTMANLLAILSQTRPGDTVLLHEDSHPFNYESGGAAMVAGAMTKTLGGACGIIEPDTARAAIVRRDDHHYSNTMLIAIENTTNRGGGAIYPLETVTAIGAIAREHGLRFHCDGARLFNAVVATGVSAAQYARPCDTICFCFSKNLGAPVGSILAGDLETIDRAHRYRKLLGGGMRQAGILAAAALYALDHHVERLCKDHDRARRFREALRDVPGLAFPLPSPTNIVYVDVPDAMKFVGRIAEQGVYALPTGPRRVRTVFHLDIDDEGLERAIHAFQAAAAVCA
jgi:threonine aldolase